jgi:hypothetical protein
VPLASSSRCAAWPSGITLCSVRQLLSSAASTRIVSPSANSPRSSACASSVCSSLCRARLTGRAPYTGSKPYSSETRAEQEEKTGI